MTSTPVTLIGENPQGFRFSLAFYARKAGNIGTLSIKDDQTCGVALLNKLTFVIVSTPAALILPADHEIKMSCTIYSMHALHVTSITY